LLRGHHGRLRRGRLRKGREPDGFGGKIWPGSNPRIDQGHSFMEDREWAQLRTDAWPYGHSCCSLAFVGFVVGLLTWAQTGTMSIGGATLPERPKGISVH